MKRRKKKTYRIAIDAMGGDFAPSNEVQGAILACKEANPDVKPEIVLVGKETKIKSELAQHDSDKLNYTIVNADEIITMNDDPSAGLKSKKNSSLRKGIDLLDQGYVDAFISAGNTGAVMSTATVVLGRINGVSRPTIGSFCPTENNYPSLLLDVGANVDAKPRFLYEFAVMGSIYLHQTIGIENPRVGLLNIGEEKSKGGKLIRETYDMLSDSKLNFVGNIEGRDILLGAADVVVCDGFTGNVLLKFAESFPNFLKSTFKKYASNSIFNKLVVAAFVPVLRKVMKGFDYQEYGGVPLLGVNGSVIIGHGKSTPRAIQSMIYRAVDLIKNDLNNKIENALFPKIVQDSKKSK